MTIILFSALIVLCGLLAISVIVNVGLITIIKKYKKMQTLSDKEQNINNKMQFIKCKMQCSDNP